jgi:predicted Fe-S protein YdhL (DUF1289 family)
MEGSYCVGCHRTIAEIARWASLGDEEKRQILAAVAQRRSTLIPGIAAPGN